MEQKMENGLANQIDIISMVRDVLRQWWVILLLALSVSLFANIWANSQYEPKYTTTTTLAVTAKGMNSNVYQNLTSTKELAARFSQVLDSAVLQKTVTKELGMDTYDVATSVEQVPETNLLTLTVTAGSAMGAYRVMQSILANYSTVSDYVIENVILEEIQPALIPEKPVNSSDEGRVTKLSFLIAAAVFAACFALFSYIRDTVKNESEFSEKIDSKLLGTVYHEKKALFQFSKKAKTASMLIQSPLRSFRFVEANKMAASRIRSGMDKEGAKVLLITSVMENEGKSTVAANIAIALAQEDKKVMLIDCDFRKPAQYKIFKIDGKDTVSLPEILKKGEFSGNIIKKWNNSLYTIFSNTSSSSMEGYLGNGVLDKILEFCRKRMDYVLIDTSPMALVSETEELAQKADASVLVIRQDMVLTKDINDAVDALNNTNGKVLGCILNDATPGLPGSRSHYGYGSRYGYGGYYGKRAKE